MINVIFQLFHHNNFFLTIEVNQSDIIEAASHSFSAVCCDDNSCVTQLYSYEVRIQTLTHRRR